MVKIKRWIIQLIAMISSNAYIKGFINGSIYKGRLKSLCVPGLNCYSCPGAIGSCPIGSLQAVIGSIRYSFSYYVTGFLLIVGVFLGKSVCGWLCPFGFIQDIIYKIPSKKYRINRYITYIKYLMLIIFVVLLPMLIVNDVGVGEPAFCKYICPAGTLEAGIPLVSLDDFLKNSIGFLFYWKTFLLAITLTLAIFIYRPFCRIVCPLGAIYSLFNPISVHTLKVDKNKCIECGVCTKTCNMDIQAYKYPKSRECIRCGDCVEVCPRNALNIVFQSTKSKI